MEQDKNSTVSWKLKVLNVGRLIIAAVFRFWCSLYYGESKKIPQITDAILRLPAIEVARKIRSKEISSVEVVETCIRRIKDVNSALNCFIEDRFELALKEAKEADDLVKAGTKTPEQLERDQPFLGVPFTTKDNIAVKGLHHTSGVYRRRDVIAEEDADVIKLLRAKGAIIIGLTNVPELCMWWETHNHIYGRTNNPYDTTKIVGGSSGGEGCIQSAAGSIFGIGSDIGGSIRMPAYFNGIFGHKPSRNIVSNIGSYPIPQTELVNSFLGTGPMTRHAVDLKPILEIISGENSSKLNLNEKIDIKKIKVYYQFEINATMLDSVDKDIVAAMKKVVEYFKLEHGIIAEQKKIDLRRSVAMWMSNMSEKKSFALFIMDNDSNFSIIKEIVKNMFGCSENTMPALFTSLTDGKGQFLDTPKYKHYSQVRDDMEKTFKDFLKDDGVLLFPTHPTPALYHNEPLAHPMNFIYTAFINCLGLPACNVPLGLSKEGLPIGLQVIANHNNDRLCLAVAEELDKAFGGWIEPQVA